MKKLINSLYKQFNQIIFNINLILIMILIQLLVVILVFKMIQAKNSFNRKLINNKTQILHLMEYMMALMTHLY